MEIIPNDQKMEFPQNMVGSHVVFPRTIPEPPMVTHIFRLDRAYVSWAKNEKVLTVHNFINRTILRALLLQVFQHLGSQYTVLKVHAPTVLLPLLVKLGCFHVSHSITFPEGMTIPINYIDADSDFYKHLGTLGINPRETYRHLVYIHKR